MKNTKNRDNNNLNLAMNMCLSMYLCVCVCNSLSERKFVKADEFVTLNGKV